MLVTLDSITTKITKGTTPTSVGCTFENSGVNFIKSESLGNSRNIDRSKFAFISEQTHEKLKRSQIEKNDILFSMAGMFLGKTGIVTDDLVPANTNQAVAIIRIDTEKANHEYVYYYLNQRSVVQAVNASSAQSAQPNINLKQIGQIEIDLPERKLQDKIVSILSAIDFKIEKNNQINENLLQQAQALFISWFVDYTPFNGTKPELWKNISVYDLAEYINGAAFKKNEYADKGLPIIKITELKNGITDATQYCCTKKDVKYYIDDRDILFSWSGNPDTSIDAFLWSNGKAILNQHTFRVVSKYDAPAFTFFLLKYLKPQFTHIASNKQTTGLGHVTVADLKRLQFCIDENAIREFNAITMPFFDMIFSNYKENQYLSSLRDTILPQLMSGKLEVPNINL